MNRRLSVIAGSILIAGVVAPTAAVAQADAGSLEPAKLTLWHNYGVEANATATENLVAAFQEKYPQIEIEVVSQPADNYFDLLQAAAISRTGPDLATQWTGLFDLKYQDYLEPLNDWVSIDELKKLKGIEYSSLDFDPDKGVLVVPLEVQFYNGFVNKELWEQAGLDPNVFPTTWDEFFAACNTLKDAGITPMVYGTGGQALGGGFYTWYDVSYLMMDWSPEQWKQLYTGELAWTDPAVVAQFERWASLFSEGCTNGDVLTNSDSIAQFENGEAAMTLEGTWQIAEFEEVMGDKVGVFLPPFVSEPLDGVVEYSGDGFSMTSYSENKSAAAAFLAYLASDEAQAVVAESGLIPAKDGFSTDSRMAQDLLAFGADRGFARYPMIDNVIQTEVVDAGNNVLNAAFGGSMSVQDALQNMEDTLNQLPEDRRGDEYR